MIRTRGQRPRIPAAAAQDTERARGAASDRTADWLDTALHWTVQGVEIAGIMTIVIGTAAASAVCLHRAARDGPSEAQYHRFRASLGRSILLGLEFLVAADIINTVAIDPTLESVAVLAGIVVVRTFLSFALEARSTANGPGGRATAELGTLFTSVTDQVQRAADMDGTG